ncbi:MAG: DUF6268 family outer membrane beta-barrel protein [Chthoniobacter sp.]|nr:DUF6268 family outer membrane beta-barrel protein [Chthoniobacter sp.]
MKIPALVATLSLGASALAAAEISHQFDTEFSLTSGVRTDLGHDRSGDVAGVSTLVREVASIPLGDGPLLRVGFDWQRFSFALPSRAPLPNTLQSLSAVVGLDLQVFDSWLIRIEAEPGFYSGSGNFTTRDFNVPFVIGGSYIASADLQWIVGVSVDLNRAIPVFPAVGVRWKFADQWVLNGVMPRPRLEYLWSRELTLYLGGDLRGSTFRVGRDFGDSHGAPKLNRAVVDFTEIRAGVGASWKVSSWLSAEIEGGVVAYRDFDFHRADENYQSKNGGAYGQLVFGMKF